MSSSATHQLDERLAAFEAFGTHYENHVIPNICHGQPLDKDCRFCQHILKKKEVR